jgi:hypothetical protein
MGKLIWVGGEQTAQLVLFYGTPRTRVTQFGHNIAYVSQLEPCGTGRQRQ